MGRIEKRIAELGESLPGQKRPVANYLGCKRSGDMLYVTGRVSGMRGEVGTDLGLAEAREAAKSTWLGILAIVKAGIGDLDRIVSAEKMNGFVRLASSFTEQPAVINGGSNLLIELFGENGRHAKTASGVAQLLFGAAVQLEVVLRLQSA